MLRQFGGLYIYMLDNKDLRQQFGRVLHQSSGDLTREVILAGVFGLECIENADVDEPFLPELSPHLMPLIALAGL